MKILTCPCGASFELRKETNVLAGAMEESGYEAILGTDGSLTWLCPKTAKALAKHVAAIELLLGDSAEYASFYSMQCAIMKMAKRSSSCQK